MSYKASSFFQDILVNEYFYIATKSKQLIRHEILGKYVICVWTQKETAETFLNKHDTVNDKIKKFDIDSLVTYEMDYLFAEVKELLMNSSSQSTGDIVYNIILIDIDVYFIYLMYDVFLEVKEVLMNASS